MVRPTPLAIVARILVALQLKPTENLVDDRSSSHTGAMATAAERIIQKMEWAFTLLPLR